MEIAHLELTGSSFERGVQHGQTLSGLIPQVLATYDDIEKASGALVSALQAGEKALQKQFPNVIEEMKGIARGSGLTYDEILYLNTVFDAKGDALHQEQNCTAVGLPQTPLGPLVGKTDDVGLESRPFEVLFRCRPEKGHAYLCYAFAGTTWNQGGMNDAGLAVAMTGMRPAGPRNPDGVPSLVFLRQVLLECSTTEEAVKFSRQHPLRNYACSMTMADRTADEITVVENFPALQAVRHWRDAPAIHTNHPLWPETRALAPDHLWLARYDTPDFSNNTRLRWENGSKLAQEIPHTLEGMKSFLGNHAQNGAICQHGQAGLHTSIAMIMAPKQGALIAAEGYGCETYHEYTI